MPNEEWPAKAEGLARELHQLISINDKNWHKQKNNPEKRAAELLSAAIVQLICRGNQKDVEALLEQSLKWLKREIKDPGCPHR